MLQNYENNHKDQSNIAAVNAYLHHVYCSESHEAMTEKFKSIYAIEARVHKEDEQQISICLHNNIDPKMAEEIVDAQFGTLTQKCIDNSCCIGKFISWLRDKVTAEEWLGTLFYTIVKSIKLLLIYVDMYKDTFLAASILITTGGWKAIRDFPFNFSSVVVICMFSSIMVPLLLSSMHLAIYNPTMLFDCFQDKNPSIVKRVSIIFLCFTCTLLNPVLLVSKIEGVQEEARRLAKFNKVDMEVVTLVEQVRRMKTQLVEILKIELGLIFDCVVLTNYRIRALHYFIFQGLRCSFNQGLKFFSSCFQQQQHQLQEVWRLCSNSHPYSF